MMITIVIGEYMKKYMNQNITKKAFALSIVLWIVAALLLGVATVAIFSKDTISLSRGLNDKLSCQILQEDTIEFLKYYIKTADFDNISFQNKNLKNFYVPFPEKMIVDNRWYNLNKHIKIRLIDTSALINISTYSSSLIANSLDFKNKNKLESTIRDSISDWRDKDSLMRLNGAERNTYKLNKEKNYFPRNHGGIQDKEELRLIHGIDLLEEEKWNKLKEKFYFGKTWTNNILLIDSIQLYYYLNLPFSNVEELIELRKNNLDEFLKKVNFNDDIIDLSLSKQLRVEVHVEKNKAKSKVIAIINFRENEYNTLETILYKSF